ncbi:hypothetical protein ULG90_17205 [Halopseudomonas pachastrellae]|nr:hypothetical protein ULG90_17205 [Halopseudomonas pachastrellae]
MSKALGIQADFTLIDDGFLVLVQKLDRVFDTNDMAGAVGVAVIGMAASVVDLPEPVALPPESGRDP